MIDVGQRPTTGNSNMATSTGNTYDSKSMALVYIVQTLTEIMDIRAWRALRKCSYGRDCINDKQPEMADESGNTYISETVTVSIEILVANLAIMIMKSDIHRQPEIAIWPPKPDVLHLSLGYRG